MSNDQMDRFKNTYISECYELLEDMEQLLLGLDESSIDLEKVNAIFRCAHSIKGGAGGFGYKRLSQVTHVLETLLDIMREGKASVTQAMIDTLLASADILKRLVKAAQNDETPDDEFGQDVVIQLEELVLEQVHSGKLHPSAGEDSSTADIVEAEADEISIYDISFIPELELFRTGNEPLMILRELSKLGKIEVKTDVTQLPDLTEMDTHASYLSWHISLESENQKHPFMKYSSL